MNQSVEREHREDHDGRLCLVTDQDRQQNLKTEKVLPRWHQKEESHQDHDLLLDDYDNARAQQDWDNFYDSLSKKKKKTSSVVECKREKTVLEMRPEKEQNEIDVGRHALGAFYGTVETQKICLNAIQQVFFQFSHLFLLHF